jgi:transcriptional regulator with XRE-family HTH domain
MEREHSSAAEVFARRLRETRRARGWTQAELAQRVTEVGRPLSRAAVMQIESGRRGVQLDEAIALAAVLHAVPAQLLSPPEGEIVDLHAKAGVDGQGMRNWLAFGSPFQHVPDPHRDELRRNLEAVLLVHAQALIDANRGNDAAGRAEAVKALVEAVGRHLAALEQEGEHDG